MHQPSLDAEMPSYLTRSLSTLPALAQKVKSQLQIPRRASSRDNDSRATHRCLKKEKKRELNQVGDELVSSPEHSSRLPPEIILQIIHLGAQSSNPGDRQNFLCTASLVCSFWRAEAQKMLWATTHLTSDKAIKSFLRSQDDGRQTLLLSVSAKTTDDGRGRRATTLWLKGALVRKAVEKCKGLGILSIGEVKQLDPLVFQAQTLSGEFFEFRRRGSKLTPVPHPGIMSLSLGANINYKSTSAALPSTHPFSLAMLQLDLVYPAQRMPSELISSLLGSATMLVVIRVLNHSGRPVFPPENLPRPTRPLQFPILGLRFPSASPAFVQPLLPALQQCDSLIMLSLTHAHADIFAALPQPINELVLSGAVPRDWNEEVALLRAGHRSLSELKKLVISGTIASNIGLETLERECRARKIEPSWAGVVARAEEV